MSITAEYRQFPPSQLEWFIGKPDALYQLLVPDNFEPEQSGLNARNAKSVGTMLADFKAFTQAMQNPGTNDALIVSKLPMMLRQWRAMLGEAGAQEILNSWAQRNPAIARHLGENPQAKQPKKDDSPALNIEKAWDGIHFVLTGSREPGDNPISRALFGDRTIPDASGVMGYGPARVLTLTQVTESARVLRESQPLLSQRFNSAALVAGGVYAMHDDPQELEYLTYQYGRLLEFYEQASADGQAMAIYMV
jgi:hypothetical protein